MPETKPIYTSKTFWGAILMLLSVVLQAFDIQLGPDDQEQAATAIASVIDEAIGFIGFILTLWGRITAKKGVTVMLLLLSGSLFLAGCSSIPTHLVEEHLNAVEPHHMALIREYGTDLEKETWPAHYQSMRDQVEASR